LINAILNRLAVDGRIFVQTDIEPLADEMFGLFRERRELVEIAIDENPFPTKTERERAVEDKGLPVYRAIFAISSFSPS
jgi:tRNA G46 methylase TrmB